MRFSTVAALLSAASAAVAEHTSIVNQARVSTPTPTPTPTAGNTAPPGPTQSGITPDCRDWYLASPGDLCPVILMKYPSLDMAKFVEWNPAVKKDCSGLWAHYAYCVGTNNDPVNPPPSTCTVQHPEPTQPGALCNCATWHLLKQGDTCWALALQYETTVDNIRKWNSNVNCNALWATYYLCVGVSTPSARRE